MAFIALKPCSFGGQSFRIGEQVPHELVLPEMKRRLISMGFLVEVFPPALEPENTPPAGEDDAPPEPKEKSKRPRAKAEDA
ncbi:MAG: hypothetical protein HFF00_04635 [Ruminiclostridium sp.]|jgi:hypothetical protein|nr:hypothetical protein [Ruminiclostridium sp.]